jgi:hypothetical protein
MVCTHTVSSCTTLACSSANIERKIICVFNLIHVFFSFVVSYLVYKIPESSLTLCNVFRLCTITFVSATLYRMPPQTYVMTLYIDRLTRQLFCKFYKGKSVPFKSWFTNRTTSQKLVLSLCKSWICTADLWVHVFTLSTSCPIQHGWT